MINQDSREGSIAREYFLIGGMLGFLAGMGWIGIYNWLW